MSEASEPLFESGSQDETAWGPRWWSLGAFQLLRCRSVAASMRILMSCRKRHELQNNANSRLVNLLTSPPRHGAPPGSPQGHLHRARGSVGLCALRLRLRSRTPPRPCEPNDLAFSSHQAGEVRETLQSSSKKHQKSQSQLTAYGLRIHLSRKVASIA